MIDNNPTSELIYRVDDHGVATITFNRPAVLNALTSKMIDELLPQACDEATRDPAVRVVVLTGVGSGFCSGADLTERIPLVSGAATATYLERPLGAFVEPVWRLPKPVIAAVNGVAAGGGMSLATAADFRLVDEAASFAPVFVRRGMMPDSGITFTLPQIVGTARARRMLMTGQTITSRQALEAGLADEVVPSTVFGARVDEFARDLASGPSVALSFIKRALGVSAKSTLAAQLEVESWGAHACFKSADFAEGLAAFRGRREPRFEGR